MGKITSKAVLKAAKARGVKGPYGQADPIKDPNLRRTLGSAIIAANGLRFDAERGRVNLYSVKQLIDMLSKSTSYGPDIGPLLRRARAIESKTRNLPKGDGGFGLLEERQANAVWKLSADIYNSLLKIGAGL